MGNTYVIDGSNVCWWGRTHQKSASISPLLTILIALIEQGDDFYCVFDASIIYDLDENKADIDGINRVLEHFPAKFFRVTASTPADGAILHYADHHQLNIITNDIYRDYKKKYPWLSKKHTDRLIQCNLQPSGLMTLEKLPYGDLDLLTDIDTNLQRLFALLEVRNAPELSELDRQLQQRQHALTEIDKQHEEREAQLNQLTAQITDQQKKYASLHTEIADLDAQRNQLKADYDQNKNRFVELEQYKTAQAKKVMEAEASKLELSDEQACIRKAEAAMSQFLEPYTDTGTFATRIRFEGSSWDIAIKKLTIFFDKNRICTHCYTCNPIWKDDCLACKKGMMTDNPKEIWKIIHSHTPR